MLETLLKSRAEIAILGVALFSENLHLREIGRRAGVSPSEAKRELDGLVGIGLLRVEKKWRTSVYSLNQACPFLSELKGLYLKTEGLIPAAREEFMRLKGIKFAFIYGSMASGKFGEKSDADVLAIGSEDADRVSETCLALQKRFLREVNFVLWKEGEMRQKIREGRAFITSVLKNKKIWLAGDEDEFGRIAKGG